MLTFLPSVVAGASYAAKVIRAGGGFTTSSSDPVMIGEAIRKDKGFGLAESLLIGRFGAIKHGFMAE